MLGAVLSFASPIARAAPRERSLDAVLLREGTRLTGRVVRQEPGRYVVIDVGDRRRTVPWDRVKEVDIARDRSAPFPHASAEWRAANGGGLTYAVRAQVAVVLAPAREYGLTGSCATGSGLAPASLYAQPTSARGYAAGGGLGVGIGYMYRWQPVPGRRSSWWAVGGAAGLDLDLLEARAPTRIPRVQGELCSQVASRVHEVEVESSAAPLAQVPIHLGALVGFGRFGDGATWHGVVLGAAWAPSYTWIAPSIGGVGNLHWFGAELSVDFATLEGAADHPPRDARFRVAAHLLPPVDESPMILKLSFGAAWY